MPTHAPPPASRRRLCTHDRANTQSRFAVATETSSTAAVSSMESPAKNRNSINRARRVHRLEFLERPVQIKQVDVRIHDHRKRPLQFVRFHAAAAFEGPAPARFLDQHPAHHLRRRSEEVRPSGPLRPV